MFSLIFAPNSHLPNFQVQDLNLEVRLILVHNGYSSYSVFKTKGELRLDKEELILKGGSLV